MSTEQSPSADAIEELRQKLHEIRQDVNDIGRLLKDAARAKIRETGAAAATRCEESYQHTQDQVEGYVRTQPLKSLLIAGCVGLVLGAVCARR